ASDWNNQVWEALFVVNESANVTKQIGGTTKQAVGGYYSGGNISVITSDGGVNELTVAHELVHALQDQRYNMSASRFSPPVQDQQLAEMGLVEGESEYIRALYERKCRSDWNCVRESGGPGVPSAGSGRGNDFNIGILMTIYQPYADGPAYIHSVVENEGWDAVDAKFEGNVPKTSEAIIHIQEDRRVNMTFNDTSNANWSLYPDQGIKGYDVAGEASIYAMFWYQTTRTGESFVDVTSFRNPEHGSFDRLNYTGVPSEGWGNDRIYPYRRVGEDAENQSQADGGYVWKTVWDTEEDAREFQSTYLDLLRTKGAEKVRETVWRIPEGGFEDAFRVVRRNATVTVVNGPTVGSLDAIRPVSNSSSEPPRGNRSDGFGFLLPLGAFAVLTLFVLLRRGD
ncbi:MAG: Hvo_1808 family surface protein, partial [Halobacteria archaeon]|nr:Hvo_1808 family surface protein [Halobacteria archaeon]